MTTSLIHAQPLWKGFDAAYPPSHPPAHCPIVCGYIAGPRALNIWKPEQWLPFQHLRQAPITVLDLAGDPVKQAHDAVAAAIALGWSTERAIIGDCETAQDRRFWRIFARNVEDYDYVPVAYGSADFVTANHAALYWAAQYDDIPSLDNLPQLPPGERWLGKQYQAEVAFDGTFVDLSVFAHEFYEMCGVGPRHQP